MSTMKRVYALINERHMSLYKLAQSCNIPCSTLKNTIQRNGQLTVDNRVDLHGAVNPMYEFFLEGQINTTSHSCKFIPT